MSGDWEALKDHLVSHTGLAYYQNREPQLLHAIRPRMEATCQSTYDGYLAYLRSSPGELKRVVSRLTVGETYFFRDRSQFQAIVDTVLPSLEYKVAGGSLQAWSAGCSIGAEPYSLACLVSSHFAQRLNALSILATDINTDVLEVAREAVYSDWALRQVVPAERALYFTAESEGRWRLRSQLRQKVQFQSHNLVSDPIPPAGQSFDMILCRNVLIYFAKDRVRQILDQFFQALVPGGWLVVGYSEPNPEYFQQFETVSRPGTVLYRRASSERSTHFWSGPAAPAASPSLVDLDTTFLLAPSSDLPPAARLTRLPPAARNTLVSPVAVEPGPRLDELKALADAGLWLEARDLADTLLEKDPLQARTHFYRALVQEQLGATQDSGRSYRQAIYLDRSDPLPHYYWGLTQRRAGALAEANRSFRTVVRLLDSLDDQSGDGDLEGISAVQLRAQALNQLKGLPPT